MNARPCPAGAADFEQRPFILFWEVTRACALACRHCRAEAQPRAHQDELTPTEALQLVNDIAELAPSMLVLTGGDPMLRRDLPEIISAAAGKGLRVGLSPAATPLLLRADLAALKQAGVSSLSLSLDGATAASHDRFRGVPHTFERTLAAARAAKEAGLMLQVNTTLSRSTLAEFPAFTELMRREVQPDVWSIFVLVPTGRAQVEDLPDAAELENVWQQLLTLRNELPFAVKTTEGHHYRRVLLQAARAGGEPPRHLIPTRDGKGVLFISHTGEVQPSGFLPITLGNVRHDNLTELYRHHPVMRSLRDDNALGGKCGQCEYRHVCGGSRARAYGVTGDMLAAEPLCNYIPSGYSLPAHGAQNITGKPARPADRQS